MVDVWGNAKRKKSHVAIEYKKTKKQNTEYKILSLIVYKTEKFLKVSLGY